MTSAMILVRAIWDEEAQVWVATSHDVPGLATEADTLEELRAKVLVMIPELLQANKLDLELAEIPVHFLAEHTARIANPMAATLP